MSPNGCSLRPRYTWTCWRHLVVKGETHRSVPFLCLLRPICGWVQTDRTSHLDQPSSIFSCQGTVTVRPPPLFSIPNGSRGASAADLCDRSLCEDRPTGDFYCHSSHFQKIFGERWSQRKLSGCCPPAQAPPSHFVSRGNEAAQCSLLLNVIERKCDWMDNESQLVSQSASTTSWWFWAKWITALKSYIWSLKPLDTIGVSQ